MRVYIQRLYTCTYLFYCYNLQRKNSNSALALIDFIIPLKISLMGFTQQIALVVLDVKPASSFFFFSIGEKNDFWN